MRLLTQSQIDQFWRDGYLVPEHAVSSAQLAAINTQLAVWVDQSRAHDKPFGAPTVDDRARFDMGEEHNPQAPALRRVNNPSEISPAYYEVMTGAAMVDMVADLIGPDLKFHHCKINLKLPGSQTVVDYHQDFAYTPHTNDDVVTALLMLDDMTSENGALTVVPGSHKGPVYSLFDEDTFTGKVAHEVERELKPAEVPIYGSAGSVCLMHTRLLHGSEANRSASSRGLYICVYTAADAFPLARNPMPSPQEGLVVRGRASRKARLLEGSVELPQQPKSASFFSIQGQRSAG